MEELSKGQDSLDLRKITAEDLTGAVMRAVSIADIPEDALSLSQKAAFETFASNACISSSESFSPGTVSQHTSTCITSDTLLIVFFTAFQLSGYVSMTFLATFLVFALMMISYVLSKYLPRFIAAINIDVGNPEESEVMAK